MISVFAVRRMAGGEPIFPTTVEHVLDGEFSNVQESEHLVDQVEMRVGLEGHIPMAYAQLQQLNELGVQLPFPRLRRIVICLTSNLAVTLTLVLQRIAFAGHVSGGAHFLALWAVQHHRAGRDMFLAPARYGFLAALSPAAALRDLRSVACPAQRLEILPAADMEAHGIGVGARGGR